MPPTFTENRNLRRLLLARSDGVFDGLRHIKLCHGLRLDLDRFAGLRVAAHALRFLGVPSSSTASVVRRSPNPAILFQTEPKIG